MNLTKLTQTHINEWNDTEAVYILLLIRRNLIPRKLQLIGKVFTSIPTKPRCLQSTETFLTCPNMYCHIDAWVQIVCNNHIIHIKFVQKSILQFKTNKLHTFLTNFNFSRYLLPTEVRNGVGNRMEIKPSVLTIPVTYWTALALLDPSFFHLRIIRISSVSSLSTRPDKIIVSISIGRFVSNLRKTGIKYQIFISCTSRKKCK